MVTEAKKDSPNQEASKPGAQTPECRRRWTDVPAQHREVVPPPPFSSQTLSERVTPTLTGEGHLIYSDYRFMCSLSWKHSHTHIQESCFYQLWSS